MVSIGVNDRIRLPTAIAAIALLGLTLTIEPTSPLFALPILLVVGLLAITPRRVQSRHIRRFVLPLFGATGIAYAAYIVVETDQPLLYSAVYAGAGVLVALYSLFLGWSSMQGRT